MKKKNIFWLIVLFLMQFPGVMAYESIVIRGRVTDTFGDPLPGVNIVELDNQNRVVKGVITDVNGNFVFEVSSREHAIQFSFIGFKNYTLHIGSETTINVRLEDDTAGIEEVMVVARSSANSLTGVFHRDQTAATTRIMTETLSGLPVESVAGALQGQVAGLDILSASGDPGSGSNIVIRGMGSIGNNNPLIVVDGIPQDIRIDNFNFASADQHDLGQLLNIAPQDIHSVEVLKDAASTAVWGSKGANGVLLIETSRGEEGKIKFNYQYKLNVNAQPPSLPMLNGDEYITMQMEQWHNAYGVYDIPQEIAYNRNFVDFYNYSANTDWIKEITRDSYTHDHFFKMSGGSRNSQYYTSLNYQDGYGTTLGTSFQRISFRANFDYSISNDLRFTTNFSYNNSFTRNNPRNIRRMAYIKAPNMSIWEYDEAGNLTGEYFNPIESYQGNGNTYFNPVAIANLGRNEIQGNEIQNNFRIDYEIFKWLKFSENLSFSYSNDKQNRFIPSSAIGVDWLNSNNNAADERNSINIRWLSRSQLFFLPFSGNYNHHMTGMVMWEMEQKQSEFMDLRTANSPSIDITDPSGNPPIRNILSGSTQSRLYGVLASLNYRYQNRYLLSLNLRTDGSSAFGESNRWGTFPSISAGWRFTSEEIFQKYNFFLQDSRLRLSWGQSGTALTDPYATYAYYESFDRYMKDPAIIPAQIQLSNLKWQTVSSWNGGVDLNFFESRITVTGDVYKSVTKDLLWKNFNIPGSTGYDRLGYFNGGELQNVGWEFFIQGRVLNTDSWFMSLNFNISQNKNSFLSFPENFNTIRGISIGNGDYPVKAEIGKPIGAFYGFRYLGVYATDEDAIARDANGNIMVDGNGDPIFMNYNGTYIFKAGDAIYQDINHDGKIDIMDAVYIGDSSPRFIGGFGSTIKYRRFTSSFNFHYRVGFDIINQVAIDSEGMLDRNNQSKAVLHRWKRYGQNEDGLLPRAYMNHPSNNLGSDRYVERGDFLRLNTVSLSYTLDKRLAGKINLSSLDIGINMRKLWTFTRYSGQDPEIGLVGQDPFWLGTDEARTPVPRVFSLLIVANF